VSELPSKVCAWCGRRFDWRKKWERDWDEIEHCSKACRASSRSKTAVELGRRAEDAILRLTTARGRHKTICPSEAARELDPDAWKPLMLDVQNAARRLAQRGTIVITKGGKKIDPSEARGPIRLGLP